MGKHATPFDFEGVAIVEPGLDPTGRYPVGPGYYTTKVEVPMTVTATLKGAVVVGWTLSPLESYAGFFGAPSEVIEGPPLDIEREFWPAVSETIKAGLVTVPVGWEE